MRRHSTLARDASAINRSWALWLWARCIGSTVARVLDWREPCRNSAENIGYLDLMEVFTHTRAGHYV